MNTANLGHFSSQVLGTLADAAWRSAAVGLIASAALRIFRVRNVALRLAVWSGVLGVALAMLGLMAVVPGMQVNAPVLREAANFLGGRSQRATNVAPDAVRQVVAGQMALPVAARLDAQVVRVRGSVSVAPNSETARKQFGNLKDAGPKRTETLFGMAIREVKSLSWMAVLGAIYFGVLAFFVMRLLAGIVLGRRLVRQSNLLRAPELRSAFAEHARMSWISAAPRIAESELISVPLTLGIMRPMILLPVNWREWEREKLSAVLAHEFSHCARHDALTQRLSLLHRAIFWFSPLSWFLERRLAELGEEASDQAALAGGTDRAGYARILLEFFSTLHTEPGRVWWQGVSMAKSGSAEKRVERILAGKGEATMTMKKSLAIGFVAVALPIVFVAAAARPTLHAQEPTPLAQPTAPTPPVAPPALTHVPPMPAAPRVGVVAPAVSAPAMPGVPAPAPMPRTPQAGVLAPAQLAPPTPAAVPAAPRVGASAPAMLVAPLPAQVLSAGTLQETRSLDIARAVIHVQSGSGSDQVRLHFRACTVTGMSPGFVVLAIDDICTMTSFSGDNLPSLSADITEREVEFSLGGKSYSIRDQGMVDRARALFEPLFVGSIKQTRLGKEQSALGEQQSTLGAQMAQIRVKTPDMTRQLKVIQAELEALRSKGSTQAELSSLQEQLADLQRKLGNLQTLTASRVDEHADDTANVVVEMSQTELAEQQAKIAKQQGELGKWQEGASKKATFELKAMLEDAIARGVAIAR